MSEETEPRKYWVGFDLGGTKMLAVVFDSRLREVARRRRKTAQTKVSLSVLIGSPKPFRRRLNRLRCQSLPWRGSEPASQARSICRRGLVLEAPNLGWKNVALRDFLAKRFGCPAVICNDVDAGVFGEYSAGAGQGFRGVLGVFPGTGIGGGFVYEGNIFRGSRSSCMEVGYLQMSADGPLAGAGPPGTLEGMASRLAISAEAAKAVFRGQAPHLRDLAGTDISSIRSSALAKSIERGDRVIEQIVRHAAELVGQGIGSLINILAPDVVILGGGLVEAMPKLYLESVQAGISRNVLPSLANCARLKVSELGDLAAAVGAAALVRAEAEQGRKPKRKAEEDQPKTAAS
ncbi:MAG UNVERIFIED_CONTAM: ROK family protein [Planctomycetaceae bacterium]|jgi:glucokinase